MSGHRWEFRQIHRRGMTLVELVVVLAVVAILSGLLVRTMSGMMKRTHLAKCADTISALNKTWGEAYAMHTRYPDSYDSLLASGGTAFTKLTPGLTSLVTASQLTADEAKALSAIGVRSVVDLDPSAAQATYGSAPLGTASRPIQGGSVAVLKTPGTASAKWNTNPLGLKRHLDPRFTVKYVAFCIGPNCSGVGSGRQMQEAPVHYGADDSINPTSTYQRYLVIFSLATDANGIVTAHFESAAGNDTEGPSSAEDHVREFHTAQSQET